MISINMMITPKEMLLKLAERAKAKRLSLDLSQKTLSEKSGVSYGVLKKFERTGQISLESLLKLALPLNALKDFQHVFAPKPIEEALSLDELMRDTSRKRGRK
jgi:transcriptional regulator with XRE-family HTH domain